MINLAAIYHQLNPPPPPQPAAPPPPCPACQSTDVLPVLEKHRLGQLYHCANCQADFLHTNTRPTP